VLFGKTKIGSKIEPRLEPIWKNSGFGSSKKSRT